ncbi:unnamed protein product [Lupinus luteus]|uniref:C2H2-type domain-containing protein n=1 Tax=Lupinus luteus TaxID=3873 RepID=A0AAV1WM61_LUPLU
MKHPFSKASTSSNNSDKDRAICDDDSSNNGDDSNKHTCYICNKVFPSKHSLFGHMRTHPNRPWTGVRPPIHSHHHKRSSSDLEEDRDDVDDDRVDISKSSSLPKWQKTGKRGRMTEVQDHADNVDEKEMKVMKLLVKNLKVPNSESETNKKVNKVINMAELKSSDHAIVDDGTMRALMMMGATIDEVFPSKHSLFGHMRTHPNRPWTGVRPPIHSHHHKRSSSDLEEDRDDVDDDRVDISKSSSLPKWQKTGKRGRMSTSEMKVMKLLVKNLKVPNSESETNKKVNKVINMAELKSSDHAIVDDGTMRALMMMGATIDEVFPSKHSLFGHMRTHPNRPWTGVRPPIHSHHHKRSSSDLEEDRDDVDDDRVDISKSSSLPKWQKTGKRGRMSTTEVQDHADNVDEKEMKVMKLLVKNLKVPNSESETNKKVNKVINMAELKSSDHAIVDDGTMRALMMMGATIDEVFPSKHSLFGHMRTHPNRPWTGVRPPIHSHHHKRSSSDLEEDRDDVDDDRVDISKSSSLPKWQKTGKRGRMSAVQDHADNVDEKEMKLMKLLVKNLKVPNSESETNKKVNKVINMAELKSSDHAIVDDGTMRALMMMEATIDEVQIEKDTSSTQILGPKFLDFDLNLTPDEDVDGSENH